MYALDMNETVLFASKWILPDSWIRMRWKKLLRSWLSYLSNASTIPIELCMSHFFSERMCKTRGWLELLNARTMRSSVRIIHRSPAFIARLAWLPVCGGLKAFANAFSGTLHSRALRVEHNGDHATAAISLSMPSWQKLRDFLHEVESERYLLIEIFYTAQGKAIWRMQERE